MVTNDPVYFECNDGNNPFEFFPLTQGSWTNVTVNWGDGSSPEFFEIWDNLNAISHVYDYEEFTSYDLTFSTSSCTASAALKKSVALRRTSSYTQPSWKTLGTSLQTQKDWLGM